MSEFHLCTGTTFWIQCNTYLSTNLGLAPGYGPDDYVMQLLANINTALKQGLVVYYIPLLNLIKTKQNI